MNTKAIIFDKDGTLMDFNAFWIPVTYRAVKDILQAVDMNLDLTETIFMALGVEENIALINGILCSGTYAQMGHEIYLVLRNNNCNLCENEVIRIVTEAYHRNYQFGIVKAACKHLADVLGRLRNQGLKLAVVTTDDSVTTQKCLQALRVESYFEYVYSDNGEVPTKPDPYCIHDFCKREHLQLSEVVMVGDTLTDMRFAQNGGITGIGIAKDEMNINILKKEADIIIRDVSSIFEVIK